MLQVVTSNKRVLIMVTNTSYKMWPKLCPLLKTLLFLLCIYIKRVTATCESSTGAQTVPVSTCYDVEGPLSVDSYVDEKLKPLLSSKQRGIFCGESYIFDDQGTVEIPCPIGRAVTPIGQSKKINKKRLANITDQVSVIWLRDKHFLYRENGNVFIQDETLKCNRHNLLLTKIGTSDSGIYTCLINYTQLGEDYHRNFTLRPFAQFKINVEPKHTSLPDSKSSITHPPTNSFVRRGHNHTFECKTTRTLTTATTYWFKSGPLTDQNRTETLIKSFNESDQTGSLNAALADFLIKDQFNKESFTINNVSDADVGFYGCYVMNMRGIDIRLAKLDLLETLIDDPRVAASSSDDQKNLTTVIACLIIISSLVIVSLLFILKRYLKRRSETKENPDCLVASTQSKTGGCKDANLRQHLPNGNLPDIYDIKTSDGFICGHLHQRNGHLMSQSICDQMLTYKNPSISSSGSNSTDEASSWGKSMSSHRDASRAFYLHTSNTTATTVPVYDHPASTGISHMFGNDLVQDSCVINPTYGFLRPENDATNWAFPRRNLELVDKIGEGKFGEVWRYIARQEDGCESFVAVKQLKHSSVLNDRERFELLAEIEIMKLVDEHPNVIKLLNYCADSEPILLIMEYAEKGELRTYLRNCRPSSEGGTFKSNITSKDLMKFSLQIAEGMAYVASKGIIHRDLAARNILVSKNGTCKVADFGFARRVSEECAYELTFTRHVPIKWMAPESLVGNKFTFKSDVFSYGVLLWEIITLGAPPYGQLSSSEVFSKVASGDRLERPEHCKDEFFTIMKACWAHEPNQRPSFRQLACQVEKLLLSENDYIELDQYPSHNYYNIISVDDEDARLVL